MKIFAEQEAQELLDKQLSKISQQLQIQTADYLLGVNETQYVQHLQNLCRVDPLLIHFDQMGISTSEKQIPAEHFNALFEVTRGKSYPRQVITYRIPFEGDERLLHCRPSTYTMWSWDVEVRGGEICFDLVNFSNNVAQIKAQASDIARNIERSYQFLVAQVAAFNDGLEATIRQQLQARKAVLQKQLDMVSALGVPIRSEKNVPKTFAIPPVERRVIIKPQAPSAAFVPEPTLDAEIYGEILGVIDDLGRTMERHPSTYEGKDEEALRDLFLIMLAPHFSRSGSVTGETFNKSGKTDILIRHEQSNVFVAECKIWKGAREFDKALDQLLGYLTWRDSKAAVICFVHSQELGKALDQVQSTAPAHDCFVREVSPPSEGRFQFEFHLKGDPTRSVQIAVLCFHLPDKKSRKTT